MQYARDTACHIGLNLKRQRTRCAAAMTLTSSRLATASSARAGLMSARFWAHKLMQLCRQPPLLQDPNPTLNNISKQQVEHTPWALALLTGS
jgi:hypothetical protein